SVGSQGKEPDQRQGTRGAGKPQGRARALGHRAGGPGPEHRGVNGADARSAGAGDASDPDVSRGEAAIGTEGQGDRPRMITLHKLNGAAVLINAELIECLEVGQQTVVALATGNRYLVVESAEYITSKVLEYRKKVNSESKIINP